MSEKKFLIRDIDLSSIKFYNIETGEELIDARDREPIQRKFDPNIPIVNLVKSSYPSYELANHPLIKKFGYGTYGLACEKWYWDNNLSKATEEELWKIYALIQADWLAHYEYKYYKERYEFRKYEKEHK